ncbi:hypothetical protein QTO34_016787 [Cnephaeus nilssonii]|uniref:Uncharacterized protein n=1 Tax=Cnephaeus nilssonii TaxID=3371016 RepID=A0AA40I319_CNENI|nr:hypothetical protein QTO34_016787 [Eptesicus nilssonii]
MVSLWSQKAAGWFTPVSWAFIPKPVMSKGRWSQEDTGTGHIPEVSIGCPERMESIAMISHISPVGALVCYLCKVKTGACLQCSVKSCITDFHLSVPLSTA